MVEVFIRLMPKLMANTIASGEKITSQRSGEVMIWTPNAVLANSSATTPVSSTPDAM